MIWACHPVQFVAHEPIFVLLFLEVSPVLLSGNNQRTRIDVIQRAEIGISPFGGLVVGSFLFLIADPLDRSNRLALFAEGVIKT